MIQARGLAYRQESRSIVERVDLSLEAGKLHALIGPNGSGKSTLLKLLSGVIKPNEGGIFLSGKPLEDYGVSERSLLLAVLLQEQWLDFPFRAWDVVAMGGYPLGELESVLQVQITQALKALDIEDLAEHAYTHLSGGEKQRVHLARLLVQIGDLTRCVLLDEPLKAIDLTHQISVMRLLKGLAKQGKSVFVVMHDLSLAAQFADSISLMSAGRVVHTGTPDDALETTRLSEVYQTQVESVRVDGQRLFYVR